MQSLVMTWKKINTSKDWQTTIPKKTYQIRRLYLDQLNEYKSLCDNLIAEIDFALKYLKEVEEKYSTSSRKTGELHSACEGLLHEEVAGQIAKICIYYILIVLQKQLRFYADDLREKLKYFNELESLSKKFNSPSLSVQDEHFLPLLRKLDECIDFIQKNVSVGPRSKY